MMQQSADTWGGSRAMQMQQQMTRVTRGGTSLNSGARLAEGTAEVLTTKEKVMASVAKMLEYMKGGFTGAVNYANPVGKGWKGITARLSALAGIGSVIWGISDLGSEPDVDELMHEQTETETGRRPDPKPLVIPPQGGGSGGSGGGGSGGGSNKGRKQSDQEVEKALFGSALLRLPIFARKGGLIQALADGGVIGEPQIYDPENGNPILLGGTLGNVPGMPGGVDLRHIFDSGLRENINPEDFDLDNNGALDQDELNNYVTTNRAMVDAAIADWYQHGYWEQYLSSMQDRATDFGGQRGAMGLMQHGDGPPPSLLAGGGANTFANNIVAQQQARRLPSGRYSFPSGAGNEQPNRDEDRAYRHEYYWPETRYTRQPGDEGILRAASGGPVPGTGGGDTVPALLTPGEFVINKSAAASIGQTALQRLNKGGAVKPKPRWDPMNATVEELMQLMYDAGAGGHSDQGINLSERYDMSREGIEREFAEIEQQPNTTTTPQQTPQPTPQQTPWFNPHPQQQGPQPTPHPQPQQTPWFNPHPQQQGGGGIVLPEVEPGTPVPQGGGTPPVIKPTPHPQPTPQPQPKKPEDDGGGFFGGLNLGCCETVKEILRTAVEIKQILQDCCKNLTEAITNVGTVLGGGGGGRGGRRRGRLGPNTNNRGEMLTPDEMTQEAHQRANIHTQNTMDRWRPGGGGFMVPTSYNPRGMGPLPLAQTGAGVAAAGGINPANVAGMSAAQKNPDFLIAGANQMALQGGFGPQAAPGGGGLISQLGAATRYVNTNLPASQKGGVPGHLAPPPWNQRQPVRRLTDLQNSNANDLVEPGTMVAPPATVGPASGGFGGGDVETLLAEIRDCVCNIAGSITGGGAGASLSTGSGGSLQHDGHSGGGGGGGGGGGWGGDGHGSLPSEDAMSNLSKGLKEFTENFGGDNGITHRVSLMDNNININVNGLEGIGNMIRSEVMAQVGETVNTHAAKLGADGGGTGLPGPTPATGGHPHSRGINGTT
jgi:hypothetical protein